MLCLAKTLNGYTLEALNGEIGTVKEFYFDDLCWTIRYLVAATGTWLATRQVLIPPHVLRSIVPEDRRIIVGLTTQQIEDSPPIDHDKPVSRQFETAYHGFYGWPLYWYGVNAWGALTNPALDTTAPPLVDKAWDAHLRSTRTVSHYHLQASDGAIGHVEDFVIDDETWSIRYLIIDTGSWLAGRRILLAPQWITRVSWPESKIHVALTRAAIQASPAYTEAALLTRAYETGLHGHYGRPGYWIDEAAAQRASRAQ